MNVLFLYVLIGFKGEIISCKDDKSLALKRNMKRKELKAVLQSHCIFRQTVLVFVYNNSLRVYLFTPSEMEKGNSFAL